MCDIFTPSATVGKSKPADLRKGRCISHVHLKVIMFDIHKYVCYVVVAHYLTILLLWNLHRCFLPFMDRTETHVKIFTHISYAAPKIQTEIIVVLDNTLASPVFKIPLELVMQGPRSNPNISLNTQHSLKSCEMLNKQVRLMTDISN